MKMVFSLTYPFFNLLSLGMLFQKRAYTNSFTINIIDDLGRTEDP